VLVVIHAELNLTSFEIRVNTKMIFMRYFFHSKESRCILIAKWYRNDVHLRNMTKVDEEERLRSIRFPQWLWDRIDEDARRCKRSGVKQMEAVLSLYYNESEGAVGTIDESRLAAITPDHQYTRERGQPPGHAGVEPVNAKNGQRLAPTSPSKLKLEKNTSRRKKRTA
jgi:hypothetical protein